MAMDQFPDAKVSTIFNVLGILAGGLAKPGRDTDDKTALSWGGGSETAG